MKTVCVRGISKASNPVNWCVPGGLHREQRKWAEFESTATQAAGRGRMLLTLEPKKLMPISLKPCFIQAVGHKWWDNGAGGSFPLTIICKAERQNHFFNINEKSTTNWIRNVRRAFCALPVPSSSPAGDWSWWGLPEGQPEQTVCWARLSSKRLSVQGVRASEQLLCCFVNKWGTHFFNLESCRWKICLPLQGFGWKCFKDFCLSQQAGAQYEAMCFISGNSALLGWEEQYF